MNPPDILPHQIDQTDSEQLRLLGILGYVYAGLECLLGIFAAIYMGIGFTIVMNNEPMGWMFVFFGALISLWVIVSAVLSFLAARWVSVGKNWLFYMIVSGLHCASFPLGTGLGVFSIVVLCRPSVKAWFASKGVH
jgi:hypothetical protein